MYERGQIWELMLAASGPILQPKLSPRSLPMLA
jgi:hypothetical protein